MATGSSQRRKSSGRPTIVVVGSLKICDASPEVDALVDRFVVSTLRILARAGADTRVVDVSTPRRPRYEDVVTADGIVLLGGGDVDPDVYGFVGVADGLYGVDRDIDEYSIGLVRLAREAGVPILGICRGSQVINVAHGGTLIPDIADPSSHHGVPPADLFVDEDVSLAADSWIGRLYGRDSLTVRNGHHQAVDAVAPGLRVVARAKDGIVEAIEADIGWCVGVQWHPEDTDGSAADADLLLGGFVDACRRR